MPRLFFPVLCLSVAGLLLSPVRLAAQGRERPNVLFITIDTLRADHLSCFGYDLLTTPRLDRLAREGVLFTRAYTPVPLTGPAHVSLLTSRYPQENGAKVNGQPLASDPRLITLPQILKRHGYQTAAYVSAWPLKERLTGLKPGFDVYDQEFNRQYQWFNSYRSAEDVTAAAVSWMRRARSRQFFLWLHYFDPHGPYDLHTEFAELSQNPGGDHRQPAHDQEMAQRIRRYDSEVAYTDHYVGKVLDELGRLGLRDSTVVIVVADHGESLGEQGYVGHGRHLFESIVHVPLIMRYPPSLPANRVIANVVSTLDLAPTILTLLQIDPPFPLTGKTLLPQLENSSPPPPDAAYFLTFEGKKWQAPKWLSWLWYRDSRKRLPLRLGRIQGEQKIVWAPDDNKVELFEFTGHNPALRTIFTGDDQGPHQAEVKEIEDWFTRTARYHRNKRQLTEEDKRVLKSLGYLAD